MQSLVKILEMTTWICILEFTYQDYKLSCNLVNNYYYFISLLFLFN